MNDFIRDTKHYNYTEEKLYRYIQDQDGLRVIEYDAIKQISKEHPEIVGYWIPDVNGGDFSVVVYGKEIGRVYRFSDDTIVTYLTEKDINKVKEMFMEEN